jgi:hypothetical protein
LLIKLDIFALDQIGNTKLLQIQAESFQIAKQKPGKEFSDHWPLVAALKPKDI